MDSEESRGDSSASSTSSNSSNNSRQSSPEPENKNDGPQSPPASPPASPASPELCFGRKSRSRSRSSNENSPQRRSVSKSNSVSSASSSSSSDNENDDATSQPKSKKSSSRSSSEDGSIKNDEMPSLRPRSPSPMDSQHSSRHSSSSSNRSLSNSRTELDADGAEREVNISHEDLSDVSDMESEKRASSNNNSKQFSDDNGVEIEAGKSPESGGLQGNDLPTLQQDDRDDHNAISDLRQKLDKKKEILNFENGKENSMSNGGYSTPENCNSNSASQHIDDLVKSHDEDALDFEAEEGECLEVTKEDDKGNVEKSTTEKSEKGEKDDGEPEEGEELEEGEVSDEEEKRPEETEPKPVCRFYTRGQCTWGMSCRFLHPGVTDKGNYTMFDLVRPVPVSHTSSAAARSASYASDYNDFRTERPTLHHRPTPSHFAAPTIFPPHHDPRAVISEPPVVVESAWERGLRTAKEMMRKASKRKEQDMDFEDKKMNLPISPEELEKDAYFLKERVSPPETLPTYSRHGGYHDIHSSMYSPPERFGRAPPPLPAYDDIDPYGRSARYRELPPHRMPQYEDERRVRPTREVIVQRVEPTGRGDEWNDPWMRSKSPGGRVGSVERVDRRRRDRRSYSSNSSYSSSTSSQSDSSSESSRSPSPVDHRRRYNSSQKSSPTVRRHGVHSVRSPSPQVRRGRRSPPAALIEPKISDYRQSRLNMLKEHTSGASRRSPLLKRRGGYTSPSPTLDKKLPYSPAHKRKRLSPTPKKIHDRVKIKRRHTSSSSGSDSSDSSASDSDSDSESSTSESSSRSRDKSSRHAIRNVAGKSAIDKKLPRKVEPPKKRSPISIEIKKPSIVGASALTSPTLSASSEKETKKSRREELLKQLRAVEDAIAKKRQKLA